MVRQAGGRCSRRTPISRCSHSHHGAPARGSRCSCTTIRPAVASGSGKTSSRALAQGRSSSSAGSFLDGSPRGPSDPSIIGSSRAHRRTVPSTPMNRPAAMTPLKKSTASRCLASCCLGGVPCSRSWRPRAGERRCELRVHRTTRSARARTQASSRAGRVAEGLYGTRSCIGCRTG